MKARTVLKPIHFMVIAGAMVAGMSFMNIACTKSIGTPAGIPQPANTFTSTISNTPTVLTSTPTKTNTVGNTATPTISSTSTPTGAYTATFTFTPTASPTITNTATLQPTTVATALANASPFNLTSGSATLTTGVYYYSCMTLSTGTQLVINGAVTIFTECFTLNNGATITGIGNGAAPGPVYSWNYNNCPIAMGGAGGGYDGGNGCAGAVCSGGGHGGAGGSYCFGPLCTPGPACATGGAANDDPIHPAIIGSAGGWPMDWQPVTYICLYPVSFGGALLELVVYNPATNKLASATVNGVIDMSGSAGAGEGFDGEWSGGGSGGALWLEASAITGSGTLNAFGGYSMQSGGGGGGIISLIANTTSFTGTPAVTGGTGAAATNNGQNGIVSKTAPPATGY